MKHAITIVLQGPENSYIDKRLQYREGKREREREGGRGVQRGSVDPCIVCSVNVEYPMEMRMKNLIELG